MGGSPRLSCPLPTTPGADELPLPHRRNWTLWCAFGLIGDTFMPDSVLPPASAPKLLSDDEARALIGAYPPVSPLAALKDIGRLDPHLARFIAMAPICFVSTASADGKQDVTPRGDPPGSF